MRWRWNDIGPDCLPAKSLACVCVCSFTAPLSGCCRVTTPAWCLLPLPSACKWPLLTLASLIQVLSSSREYRASQQVARGTLAAFASEIGTAGIKHIGVVAKTTKVASQTRCFLLTNDACCNRLFIPVLCFWNICSTKLAKTSPEVMLRAAFTYCLISSGAFVRAEEGEEGAKGTGRRQTPLGMLDVCSTRQIMLMVMNGFRLCWSWPVFTKSSMKKTL